MPNAVYANNREISCKAGQGKVICAFPDVCFTPPQTPATPPGVPVPYPITSMSSDTTEGSKSVRINNKEVMLRNLSSYKKCVGDEAGCAPKKGMITSSNRSQTFFKAWSMDVKIEGKNVVRHFDLTTSNHRSEIGNASVPMINQEGMVLPPNDPACEDTHEKMTNQADELPGRMSRVHEDRVTRGEARTIAEAYGGRRPPATTVGVGQVFGGPAGGKNVIPAHSRKLNGKKYRDFAQGVKKPSDGGNTGCDRGGKFNYRSGQNDHRHAEAKIIEDWFKSGGQGQLVLSVSRPVCPNCARLIRHVNCGPGGKRCNKVYVCDSNQSPEAVERLDCDYAE